MRSREFDAYKARYRAAIRQVLSEAEPGRLDEIGFPAYSHANPIINWLFWKRLHTVIDHIEEGAPYDRVLDFGCGSGVMLPFLSTVSRSVVAADVDLVPLQHMVRYVPLASNVQTIDITSDEISLETAGSFDLIIALDVLEHVPDLDKTSAQLLRLLKPGCQLVVSGPTENLLYRFGRRLAGPEYSGDYHERGVDEIRRLLAKRAELRQIATLYWPAPLFQIFTASQAATPH
jgi:2-polyprenyl-3-methyl-5-hydroxy-6-metoxy-1,4-benzoquinol methylase